MPRFVLPPLPWIKSGAGSNPFPPGERERSRPPSSRSARTFTPPWREGWKPLRCVGSVVVGVLLTSSAAVGQDSGAPTLEEGIRLFHEGRLADARRILEATHERQPTDTRAAFYLGRVAFAEDDFEAAIGWFAQAADDEGCPAEAHLWLGRAYGYQAQRSSLLRKPLLARKVHAHLEQSVACDPDHVAARWDLMEYYAKAPGFLGGSRQKAGEQAAVIARLDPAEGRKARQFLAEMDD